VIFETCVDIINTLLKLETFVNQRKGLAEIKTIYMDLALFFAS